MHAYEHSITVTTWYADVFLKLRDEQGNISSDDANRLITLYDAAHLRTHGEHVLDSVIVFNRIRLQLLLMRANLQPDLAGEVRLTLETPRFRRVKRVEARRYLAAYEKMAARDDAILEFAKSGYNIVQALYCEELKELTM
jgi:(-)-germacrene D synthase